MPLTSKDNGPELKPGDYVKMEWVVARVFADLDVAMITRRGGTGAVSSSPQVVTVRMGTGKATLKIIPAVDTLREGARCLVLWRVTQVFPSTGTILAQRSGVGGSPERPTTITASAGAQAAECEYVPPGDVKPAERLAGAWARTLDAQPALPADVLPYLLDTVAYDWPADGWGPAVPPDVVVPVLTGLVPASAVLGSPSFTLRVIGSGFSSDAVIVWNGSVEPTTVVSSTEVTTLVNMATAQVPLPVPVLVQNAAGASNTLTFSLVEAATQGVPPAC